MGIYLGKNKISMFGGTHKVTEGVDTSDGNITEDDVLNGKVAYSNGERIIGNIPNYNGTDMQYESITKDGDNAAVRVLTNERFAICPDDTGNGYIDVNIPLADFGNATPADVMPTKYFTSKDGIKIRGTLSGSNNINLQYESIVKSGTNAVVKGYVTSRTIMEPNNGKAYGVVNVPLSNFGDAVPADVMSGKYFTSNNGLKIQGTHKCTTIEATSLDGLYIWEKGTFGGNYKLVDGEELTDQIISVYIASISNEYESATYSDSVTYDDGSIALVNPSTVLVDSKENAELLLGKYITISGTTGLSGYYRIPSDATMTVKSSGGGTTKSVEIRCSKMYKVTAEEDIDAVGYIVTTSKSAFSEGQADDGYYYKNRGTVALS